MKADLHMHTKASDGRLTNEELFKRAASKGVDVIAVTDHDVCKKSAVEENKKLAKDYDIHYIPAIELSTLYKGKSVHILGYFKEDGYASKAMESYYKKIKKGRELRAQTFIENLKKHYDITITYDKLLKMSRGIIARPHIAKAIEDAYPKYSKKEIFDNFIGNHTAAYVPSTELSTKEGIRLLKAHGAIVVLAHPVLLKHHIHDEVLKLDIDGLEAIYPKNTEKDTTFYKTYAKDNDLLITAGSDYHGIENDPSHGDIGDVTLTGADLKQFLESYESQSTKKV